MRCDSKDEKVKKGRKGHFYLFFANFTPKITLNDYFYDYIKKSATFYIDIDHQNILFHSSTCTRAGAIV